MRKKILIGNWKMFKTPAEGRRDFSEFARLAEKLSNKIDLGIAAPAVTLSSLAELRSNGVAVYAQNSHWAPEGAFTGETSVPMLKSLNIKGSLIAHSERRQFFGETNITAGKRMNALLSAGLECVFCIGETLSERESGNLQKVIVSQIKEAFNAAELKSATDVIGANPSRPLLTVAYEPVWAIGTGKSATSSEAEEAHAFVRKVLAEVLGKETADVIRIQYGGSVTPANAEGFMKCPNVDGALIGGASLKPETFFALCESVAN